MKSEPAPRVVQAERWAGGVIITFEDGKCAAYSSQTLRSILSHAMEIKDEDEPQTEAV
jgi:hypothetical protein